MSSPYLDALAGKAVDRVPIWLMRQAGRYLPEYRALRKRAGSFLNLCKTPEFSTEAILQPIRRFDLDAAILFSDILTIPDAMGLELSFVEGEGPRFAHPIASAKDIDRLPNCQNVLGELSYVFEAVAMSKEELPKGLPLIGFSGSPWTLAVYMLEGKSSKNFNIARSMVYREPQEIQRLLEKLSEVVIGYLSAQVEAGADALVVFDTWGGLLSADHYPTYSLNFMRKIVEQVRKTYRKTPITLFSKGCAGHLELMANSGCQGLGVDWTVRLGDAFKRVGARVALQGNLDPAMLLSTPEAVSLAVAAMLREIPVGAPYIANLGHGIYPESDPACVEIMVDAVHNFVI